MGRLDGLAAPSQHRAMARPRIEILLAAACCMVACGERPEPPGTAAADRATVSTGGGGSGGQVTVREEVQPGPTPPVSVEPEDPEQGSLVVDGGSPQAPDQGAGVGAEPTVPVSPGLVFAACTATGGGCTVINVAVSNGDAESCIQIALDDCEASAQAGLPVDLPVSWRLGAASVGPLGDECLPGASYNPMTSTFIVDGSGSISWNLTSRQPSEFIFDVTLVPSSTAADTSPIPISSMDLVNPLPECAG